MPQCRINKHTDSTTDMPIKPPHHRIIASLHHMVSPWGLLFCEFAAAGRHLCACVCVCVTNICVVGCAARWRGSISRTIFVSFQAPCILGLRCFSAKLATIIGFTNFPFIVGKSLPGHPVQLAGTRGRLRSPVTGEGIEKLLSFRRKSASVIPVPNSQLPSTRPSPTPLTHHTFPT